jgi:hypothetical protein
MKSSILGALCALAVVTLFFYVTYHRNPIIYHEPIIYPIHVHSGDVLISQNGTLFVFQYAETVSNVNFGDEIISVTGRPSLADRIFNRK